MMQALDDHLGRWILQISFSGLSEFAEPLLGLVNELAREASFPQAEFERERRQKLEEVKMQRTEPDFLASERLRKVLFGAHPYAQVAPSGAQVEAYKREDLQAVYREFYTPENALLLLVGDFEPESRCLVGDLASRRFRHHYFGASQFRRNGRSLSKPCSACRLGKDPSGNRSRRNWAARPPIRRLRLASREPRQKEA